MAVVETQEIWAGRDIVLGERWQRTYTRIFRVRTDTPKDGAIEQIQGVNGIPLLYSTYVNASNTEFDLLSLCNKIQARQDNADDPYEWTVTCSYSTRTFDPALLNKSAGQSTDSTDPLSRLPDVQWSFLPLERPLLVDYGSQIWRGDGGNTLTNPNAPIGLSLPLPDPSSGLLVLRQSGDAGISPRYLCDAAGVPFDPPIVFDDSRLVLNYRRNEAFYDPLNARLYKDAVNTDTFLQNSPNIRVKLPDGSIQTQFGGFPPGSVRCANIGAVRKFESATIYWEINYEFQISFEGWYVMQQNAGYYQIDSSGVRQPIKDGGGNQVVTPWPLDPNGAALTQTQILNGKGNYLYYFPFRELPFAPLGIT
jgi:hypothetical protein